MPRFLRSTPFALAAVIAASAGGLYAAATLGVRDADSPHTFGVRPGGAAGTAQAAHAAAVTPSPVAEKTDPVNTALAAAPMNSVQAGPGPELSPAPDAWSRGSAQFELFRTWEGESTLWRGSRPQIILGPEGNWFPAGQPGCGEGAYVISFRGTEGDVLAAQLRDSTGALTRSGDESGRAEGWMLIDDCHLPYVQLAGAPGGPASAEVGYTVHEYHRASS